MNIKSILFGFIGLLILSTVNNASTQKSLFIGSIQFPSTINLVPSIRVYYAGGKIICETDDNSKKVIYSIPEFKQRTFFYLLISHDVEFCSHENTVPFLKLKNNCPHKFYALQRIPVESKKRKRGETAQPEFTWIVKELNLQLPDGRIPDETIIVRYNPEYVETIEGGNAIEFPKIIIKKDILKLVGSENKLHDISNNWLLAAMNTDTIHEATQSEFVANPQAKTVLAMTI